MNSTERWIAAMWMHLSLLAAGGFYLAAVTLGNDLQLLSARLGQLAAGGAALVAIVAIVDILYEIYKDEWRAPA